MKMNLVTPEIAAEHELLFNKPASVVAPLNSFKYKTWINKADATSGVKHPSLFQKM
jgi:hypothetical protein